jgi:hypothetical protein
VNSTTASGNAILSNSVFSNGFLGIDLNFDGVTSNDGGDGDIGPNTLQNYPILSSAQTSNTNTTIQGTLNSAPNRSFNLQFFSSPECDSSGHGEGKVFVGSSVVATDGNGDASFTITLSSSVSVGQVISATATDSAGSTSEFSGCVTVAAPSCSYSITPSDFNPPANGGSSTVSVTTGAGCAWTASSNQPWLTIASGHTGSGPGIVSYFASPNIGSQQRTGSLTVAGRILTVVQPALAAGMPVLVSEAQSTRAIALDAFSFLREPFALESPVQLGSIDRRTRVMLFTMNFDLMVGENISVVTAEAEDASHRIYPLTVEYVGKVPGLDWLGYVVIRLHDDMQDLGDVLTRITVRGMPSNRVRVGIGHVGGGLPDDGGAVPTPGRQP